MNIGVFGDSYADKNSITIWWQYLKSIHGHKVECFGEPGSSLSFSVDLIQQHHAKFDRIIWCATSVNRISFWHKDKIYHNTGTHRFENSGDIVLDRKRAVIHDYLVEMFEWHYQEILGKSLIDYMQKHYDNLLIIPCFITPVYFLQEHKFNLFDLCTMEVKNAYPQIPPENIINSHKDLRHGHITKGNQIILANLINNQLDQSIFCTDYSKFNFDIKLLQQEIQN